MTHPPLGRDTAATVRHWSAIRAAMAPAPRLFRGPLPRKSPDNRRYRNHRYRNQEIGCCVGQSLASMVETLLRMPLGRTLNTPPDPAVDLSPLWTYYVARRWSFAHGINLGGEGAIVSHGIQAVNASGVARMADWPDTAQNEQLYSDRQTPPAATSEAKDHLVRTYGILETWDDMLAAVAAGFIVQIGIEIPQGFMQTDDAGRFTLRGGDVGGHAITFEDYDQDQDIAYIGNSWDDALWGMRAENFGFGLTAADLDPRRHGRVGVGVCSLTDLGRYFTARMMSTGQSEAVVANTVDGWAPKLLSFADVM